MSRAPTQVLPPRSSMPAQQQLSARPTAHQQLSAAQWQPLPPQTPMATAAVRPLNGRPYVASNNPFQQVSGMSRAVPQVGGIESMYQLEQAKQVNAATMNQAMAGILGVAANARPPPGTPMLEGIASLGAPPVARQTIGSHWQHGGMHTSRGPAPAEAYGNEQPVNGLQAPDLGPRLRSMLGINGLSFLPLQEDNLSRSLGQAPNVNPDRSAYPPRIPARGRTESPSAASPKPSVRPSTTRSTTTRLVTPSHTGVTEAEAAVDAPVQAASLRAASCGAELQTPTFPTGNVEEGSNEVILNVYFMKSVQYDANRPGRIAGGASLTFGKKMYQDAVGMYHVGISVYGEETTFGNYRASNSRAIGSEKTGIMAHVPRKPGPSYHFKEAVSLGHTSKSKAEIEEILDSMGHKKQFSRERYVLVHNNCVDFCRKFAEKLGVSDVPTWYYRGALAARWVGYGGAAPNLDDEESLAGEHTEPHEISVVGGMPEAQLRTW